MKNIFKTEINSERVSVEEIEVLLELLERAFNYLGFFCEEMSENKEEWDRCESLCEYTSPQRECFVRYAKMKVGNNEG